MKISIKLTPNGTYQICAQGEGEDFYSVLAEIKQSNFCPEHNLEAEKLAFVMAAAFSSYMGYQLDN